MTMMCVRCYLEGRPVPVGVRVSKSPPFAFMVYEGESRCTHHVPAPAFIDSEVPAELPVEFPPLEVVPEVIETDNRFIVEDEPVKAPSKRPAKKAAQQRKRTKS